LTARRVLLLRDAAGFAAAKTAESACSAAPAGAAKIAADNVSPKANIPVFMALLLWCALIPSAPRVAERIWSPADGVFLCVHIHFMERSVHIHRKEVKP
jgi:hypothetical protein